MKKINIKGFKLVMLLATIAILSLLTIDSDVPLTEPIYESKEKSEEAFVSLTKKYIEDYISLYSSNFRFGYYGIYIICYPGDNEEARDVTVYMAENIDIEDVAVNIADDNVFINPRTNIECTKGNTEYFYVYRNSDNVYCYEIENTCFSEAINTCESLYNNWNQNEEDMGKPPY